jgi:hypothetical protein
MITVFPGSLFTAISVGLVGLVGQALVCMGDLASDILPILSDVSDGVLIRDTM